MTILKKSNRLPHLILMILLISVIMVIWYLSKSELLKAPESIAFDGDTNTFLISCTGGGNIVSLDNKGKYSLFCKGLDSPRGLKLLPPYLYVAEPDRIVAIDLKTKNEAYAIEVEGARMLNDIESDHNGLLYATDTAAGKLFVVDPASKKAEALSDPLLQAPNGIVYDYPRRQMLIVCFKKASPILTYNLETKQFGTFKDTLYDNLDGIAIDRDGRIWFSSWGEKTLFQIPQEQNRFLAFKTDLESPADIYYHQPTNELLLPLQDKNSILRLPLP
jgi:sugar lactone lactonase YvrE